MLIGERHFVDFWQSTLDEVIALRSAPVRRARIPLRSNELSTAWGLSFTGIGDYPLFAYYLVPKVSAPFTPLFQAPGYGSVVAVPAWERRNRFAVMALCHRGQRLSDDDYKAAYPGLLTDGLPDQDTYRWREMVADCLRGIDVLLDQPEINSGNLAISGSDLAFQSAALRNDVEVLLTSGQFVFDDWERYSASTTDVYPQQEFNDYRRLNPEKWEEAERTLGLFDPMKFAPNITANTLLAVSGLSDVSSATIADAINAEVTVLSPTEYSALDHLAQEDWLAEASGEPKHPGPFLPR
ncbi:MAG: acetylxylan esterase [Chloroflexota bacterium]|nr:acetylxylan esterase [Chloroflexota bacterium]